MDDYRGVVRAAHVADALDSVGLRQQCLPAEIRQLSGRATMIGRALPVTARCVDHVPEERYAGLLRAMDDIQKDDVFVMSALGREDVALWGELLSTAAMARGGAGAVLDGSIRDTEAMREMGFPVFATGTMPLDIHGRLEVVGHREPIMIGSVEVVAGALIVADVDGVVVVPPSVEREVMAHAFEKANTENGFRNAVRSGMAPSEAFERFDVL